MVTTRSASTSPVKKVAPACYKTTHIVQEEAPKLLLVPANLSLEARIVSLRHPRDGSSKRFLFCPTHGLYEFTRVSHPPTEYRSMLFSRASREEQDNAPPAMRTSAISDGYIVKDAQMLVASVFDLCFVLLALLPSSMTGTANAMLQPLDDLFENLEDEDRHFHYILKHGRQHVEKAMVKICDTFEAGEVMYKISEQKTVALLQQKVLSIVEKGLPASMEERFVTRALETPVLSVKREESTLIITKEDSADMDEEMKAESFDTQSTVASSTPSVVFSEVSATTSTTIVENTEAEGPPGAILHLQRQRVALDFIIGSYLPSNVAETVQASFAASDSPIDFKPLVEHMASLAKLKAEALATRSLGDFSRKRGLDEEEAAEERAEKKRKQEEDEKKRKANTSRGVKELAKVNVTGMKKMSDFFLKKPATSRTKS
jgi:hypothetical protein